MDQVVSSAHIRHQLRQRFDGYGATAKMARALGIHFRTAAGLRRGETRYSLVKGAAYLGFVPAALPDEWRKVPGRIDPKTVGYRRWTPERVADLRRRAADARSLSQLALETGRSVDSIE